MRKATYFLLFLLLWMPLQAFAADIDVDVDSNDAVDVGYGGTNAATAAAARVNLGVEIGVDVEPAGVTESDILDLDHTATAITDGLIVEADLNADEAPVDNDLLTYDTTGANFSWQTPTELGLCTSGGAFHDGFSDFVAAEHIDWAGAGAGTIHTDNYVENATHTGDVSGSGALTIGNDKVLEAHLKAVDVAVDEECLTYESTTGDFEWQVCGSGTGDVTQYLSPLIDEIGVWYGGTDLRGYSTFKYDGTDLYVTSGVAYANGFYFDTDLDTGFTTGGADIITFSVGGVAGLTLTEALGTVAAGGSATDGTGDCGTDKLCTGGHTHSTYLPLAAGSGSSLTGELYTDNLGINFVDSDTNPTCGAGEYKIYSDTSETTLKKCLNGVVSDLDTTGSGSLGTNLSSTTNDILSDTGLLVLGGTGGTHNENVQFNFESSANTVLFGTTSGVTTFAFDIPLIGIYDGDSNYGLFDVPNIASNITYTLPSASTTILGHDTTNTLTNKTIDADGTGNSITNIENADIKAAAAIDATKIADGTVSSAEYQYISTVTSNVQTQLDDLASLQLYNVKDSAYGAAGDGIYIEGLTNEHEFDGATYGCDITSGTATLDCSRAIFTAGQPWYSGTNIVVTGAGAAGANLVTTIIARVDNDTVTLDSNAGTTVTDAQIRFGEAGCSITTGTDTLTCTGATPFTAQMVTDSTPIIVEGAGAAGVTLSTTIDGYTSSSQVSLAANASTTVDLVSIALGSDDTAEIQAAIDAAEAAGGGNVYSPPGRYRFTSLTIQSGNVVLSGAGGATILSHMPATGSYAIDFEGASQERMDNNAITDLVIEGEDEGSDQHAIHMNGLVTPIISNVVITNMFGGLLLGGVWNPLVDNLQMDSGRWWDGTAASSYIKLDCEASDVVDYPIASYFNNVQMKLWNDALVYNFDDAIKYGIDVLCSDGLYISNLHTNVISDYDIFVHPGAGDFVAGMELSNFQLDAAVPKGTSKTSIKIDGTLGTPSLMHLSNGFLWGNYTENDVGIDVDDTRGFKMSNVTVNGWTTDAITIDDTENVTITGSTIYDNSDGIILTNVDSAAITGNLIGTDKTGGSGYTQATGLQINTGSTNYTITGNIFGDNNTVNLDDNVDVGNISGNGYLAIAAGDDFDGQKFHAVDGVGDDSGLIWQMDDVTSTSYFGNNNPARRTIYYAGDKASPYPRLLMAGDDDASLPGNMYFDYGTGDENIASTKFYIRNINYSGTLDVTSMLYSYGDDFISLYAPSADPDSGGTLMMNSSITFWQDEANNELEVRMKESGGSYNNFTIPTDPEEEMHASEHDGDYMTANSDILNVDVETVTFTINKTLEDPADADAFLIHKAPRAFTIIGIDCITSGGTSAVIDIQECSSTGTGCATVDATITCDSDGAADDGTLSNPSIDTNDWVKWDIGTVTAAVDYVTVTISGTYND